MSRVIVYRFPNDGIDEAELLALLEEAGCELIDDSEEELPQAEADEVDDGECPPDALIVVLTESVVDDPNLEQRLIGCVSSSCPIIAVWPKGASGSTTPPLVENYSSDQVAWDAGKLRRAITGTDEPLYDASNDQPRERPETPTNKC